MISRILTMISSEGEQWGRDEIYPENMATPKPFDFFLPLLMAFADPTGQSVQRLQILGQLAVC